MRVLIAATATVNKLADQITQAYEWTIREGHEVVGVVADQASKSAPVWERPNLEPWMTDAGKVAKYDAILWFTAARGEEEDLRIRQWVEDKKKTLVIGDDGPQWPPRDDNDRVAWEVKAMVTRKEGRRTQARVKHAQETLQVDRFVGRVPFGYTVVGDRQHRKLVPTDLGRKYIPQIFQQYISGKTFTDIAAWLITEAVPSTRTSGWSSHTVGHIIDNSTYTGQRDDWYGQTTLRCEPLINADTFKQASEIRSSTKKVRSTK